MKKKLIPDIYLLLIVIVLVITGFLAVHNTSITYNLKEDIFEGYIALLIFSCIISIIIIFMPSLTKILDKSVMGLVFVTIVILILVFIPGMGLKSGNARRWIDIGGLFTFQPSEFAKLTIIIYLSSVLSKKGNKLHLFKKGFLPPLVVLIIIVALIAIEPDFGTAMFFAIVGFLIFFYTGIPIIYLIAVGTVIFILGVLFVTSQPYMYERIQGFTNQSGYQISQAIASFERGGIFGMPLEEIIENPIHLPAAITDFILASIAQSMGLFGTVLVALSFLFFMIRGFVIVKRIDDLFSRYLAFSIVISITTQAYTNMLVAVSLLPITGMTLPFISYGRNSMFITMIMCSILLNISREAIKK